MNRSFVLVINLIFAGIFISGCGGGSSSGGAKPEVKADETTQSEAVDGEGASGGAESPVVVGPGAPIDNNSHDEARDSSADDAASSGGTGSSDSNSGNNSSGGESSDDSSLPLSYTIGGQVSGLKGALTLVSGEESRSLNASGSFIFTSPLINGTEYDLLIDIQPLGQVCRVANGQGVIGQSDVSNIHISCVDASAYAGIYQLDNPESDSFVPVNFVVDNSGQGESEDLSGNRAYFTVNRETGEFSYSFDSGSSMNDIGLVAVSGNLSSVGALSVQVCATDFAICSEFHGERM